MVWEVLRLNVRGYVSSIEGVTLIVGGNVLHRQRAPTGDWSGREAA